VTLSIPSRRRRSRGMGDASTTTSAASTCGAWDYIIGPSTACCAYLQSTNPNSLLYQWDCPQAPSVAAQVGTTAGSAVGSAVSAAVGAATGTTGTPANSLLMYGAIAAAVVALVFSMKK
jgi:hypothetical protein